MNPALAMCAPGPPLFGPRSAVPRMVPSGSTATTARAGNGRSQYCRASSEVIEVSQQKVWPARTMPSMKDHIAGQSAGVAGLMITLPRIAAGRRIWPVVSRPAADSGGRARAGSPPLR
jgi:hypothetical protein